MQTKDKVSLVNPPGPNPQRGWSRVGAENSSTLYQKGLLKSQMTEDLSDAKVSRRQFEYFQHNILMKEGAL